MRTQRMVVFSSARCASFEALEERRMLSSVPWGTQSTLIHQPQAIADYPWITGAGQTVAVLDTGADYNIPTLGGGFGAGFKVEGGYDYISNDSDPMDTDGHGTGVSSLLAGSSFQYTDEATGVNAQFMGVAPGVNLVVVRYDDGTNKNTANENRLKQSLDWVIANRTTYNIVAVNISNGFGNYSDVTTAPVFGSELATLAADGVFIAAASGNSGTTLPGEVESPAADPNVYAVGSVDLNGQVSSFTQRGPLMDILAPGDNVTLPYLLQGTSTEVTVDTGDGTSFSSPQVTGAAALLKQIDPNFTPGQIIQILEESGTPVYDSVTNATYPLLNLDAAIALAYSTAGDPYGQDNSIASATPLNFDGNGVASVSDHELLVHNDDYYSFTLTSPTIVRFTIGTNGAAAPPFDLYSNNGTLLSHLGTDSTQTLQAGTYDVKVTAGTTASMVGTYSLSVTQVGPATSTGNNTLATALPITLSNGQGSIGNQQSLNGDDDYYSFVLGTTSQTTLTLQYNGDDAGPTATLLASNGTTLAAFNGSSLSGQLAAGTYYVDVSAAGTLDGTFSLGVAATAVPPATSPIAAPPAVGANGVISSAAYSSDGTLHLAWFDQAEQTLEYASQSPSGVWSTPQQVDPEVGVGQSLSLAITPSGQTGIAYFDAEDGQLRYALLNGSTWTIWTVDTRGSGVDPSLAYTAAGGVAISYYNNRSENLRYATFSHHAWQVSTVDSSVNVGLFSSIAIDPANGLAGIAYVDSGHGTFKYATQTSRGWSTQTVDSSTRGGGNGISLAFNHSNEPAFSYYDAYNADLKFAQLGTNGRWSVATVASKGAQGLNSNLSFTRRGSADIVYYNKSSNAVFSAVGSIGSFTFSTMASNVGQYLTVAADPLGGTSLIFFSPAEGSLGFEDV